MRKQITAIAAVALLGGCSIFEGKKTVDPVFENAPTGVDAELLVDQLPEDLPGDAENARHSRDPRVAEELAPPQ